MEEYEEYSQAVLASAGSGAALTGSRRLQQVGKKKKTKCSFPDLMGIFADRWALPAVPAVPAVPGVHAFTVAEPLAAAPPLNRPNAPLPLPHAGAGVAVLIANSPCLPPSELSWTSG
jgi:hypothetical protein